MLTKFIQKHFGGIPKSFKDLQWIIRVNPTQDVYLPVAEDYRTVSPGSQPPFQHPPREKLSKNHYYLRDSRRNYPQTYVLDQKLIGQESPLPPILNNRYKYTPSAPHLKADQSNPEFSIKGVQ
ncbi:hypothetical protein EDD86DRAFT_190610 [Gorgonomyces haynaldii]|nr:hypothetical protein EDD86DRAFT_190610 [Gorgonomyces haynaldii]